MIQWPLMDRSTEALGATDIGIIMYRKMLEENISIVEDGGDPMNVHRTAPESGYLPLSIEHCVYPDYQPQTSETQETRGAGGAVELVQGLK